MIHYSFHFKFKRNILKNRCILFRPIVGKCIEFYHMGKLHVNQIFTILPSFYGSHYIKETKLESLKLDHSICDTEKYFLMQKI